MDEEGLTGACCQIADNIEETIGEDHEHILLCKVCGSEIAYIRPQDHVESWDDPEPAA